MLYSKKDKSVFFILLLFIWGTTSLSAQKQLVSNKLITYPAPKGVTLNNDFNVKVRIPGGDWQSLDDYLIKVDEVRNTHHF